MFLAALAVMMMSSAKADSPLTTNLFKATESLLPPCVVNAESGADGLQAETRPAVIVSIDVLPPANKPVAISVSPNKACSGFYVECLPTEIAKMIPNDEVLLNYLKNKKAKLHKQEFSKKALVDLGIALHNNTDYTVCVVPLSESGQAGSAVKKEFNSGYLAIKGKPSVSYQVLSVGPDSVKITFTPNADVAAYGLCMFPQNTAEAELQKHGRTMGFTTVADMIKQFSGRHYAEPSTKTWNDLVPNSSYDFCIQAWDKNGRFVPLQKAVATTTVLGGAGAATVDIEIGAFGGDESTGYFQIVVYTPNDQAALHRDIIITEEAFNKPDMGAEGVLKMLQTDAPEDPYWNQYRVDKAQWNALPNTKYIACSVAKNAKGEWGKLQMKPFTTPAK